jgi:hypothetical protein
LFSLGKNPPPPEPAPYAATGPTPVAVFSPPAPPPPPTTTEPGSNSTTSSVLPSGTYTGSGKNTTYNVNGDFLIRIDSVEGTTVKGYFEASNGLSGNGPLTGVVDSNGKLALFGKMSDGQGLIVTATVVHETIRGTYMIGNKKNGVQKGEFTVSR